MMGTPQKRWREIHQSWTIFDHFVDAVFTPTRDPLHGGNFFERFRAKRFLLRRERPGPSR